MLNNYAIAFPVKIMFFSRGDEYHYLFIAPGYDVFELETPVQMPNLGTSDFTTNTCLNLFFEKDADFYLYQKAEICKLINRCTITPKSLQEIREAPLKLTKTVIMMCTKVRFKVTIAEKSIFAFMMGVYVNKKIKERLRKKIVMKSKFKYWARTLINYVNFLHKKSVTIQKWYNRLKSCREIIIHANLLKYQYKLQRDINITKICQWKNMIASVKPTTESLPWERFFLKPVWYSSMKRFCKEEEKREKMQKIVKDNTS
jgi:hypothetical protein